MIAERTKFGCLLFYLVEGRKPHGNIHHVSVDALEAHLDHLLFDHNIVTIYSDNVEKTPERIFSLIKHYMTSHTNPFGVLEKKLAEVAQATNDQLQNNDPNCIINKDPNCIINSDPNCIINKDPNCIINFNLIPELKQTISASDSLKTVKKMSDEAIKYSLWNCIEGVNELNFVALNDINASLPGLLIGQYTIGQLSHAKYRLGTLIGEKKLSKIIASAIQNETHIKILGQIPSVSINRARIILSNVTLSDIVCGIVNEEKLSNINMGGASGRRLGNSAARNIIKYLTIKNDSG
jgi:hypothetical protein